MSGLVLTASSAGLVIGLVYFRTGRGPLRLAVLVLIHIQAALSCAAESVRVAVNTFRRRYREHIRDVVRSY
jgi:hypothetical protein